MIKKLTNSSYRALSIFIFPIFKKARNSSGNSYLREFTESFSKSYSIQSKGSRYGLFSILFNFKADIYVLHWIESINNVLQGFVYVFSIIFLRLLNKKVVWVLHNKQPHKGNVKLGKFYMKVTAFFCSKIVTHASEGLEYVLLVYGKKAFDKTHYIPHPVYTSNIYSLPNNSINYDWDIIVWGNIQPYKNILEFLKFVKASEVLNKKRILICGNCSDDEYLEKITSNLSSNVVFINEFLSESKLQNYLLTSKAILFTYNLDSVLSSGALIYSLNYLRLIIGPNGGAFKDLNSIVSVYDSFEDLELIDYERKPPVSDIEFYIKSNTWAQLPEKIMNVVY